MQNIDANTNLQEIFLIDSELNINKQIELIQSSNLCTLFHLAFNQENTFFIENTFLYVPLLKRISKLADENLIEFNTIIKTMKIGCEVHSILDDSQKYANFKFISDRMNNQQIFDHFKNFFRVNEEYLVSIINDVEAHHKLFKDNLQKNTCSIENDFETIYAHIKIHNLNEGFKKNLKLLNRISTLFTHKIFLDVKFSVEHPLKDVNDFLMKNTHAIKKLYLFKIGNDQLFLQNIGEKLTKITCLSFSHLKETKINHLPTNLKKLFISSCKNLKEISFFPSFLQMLSITKCHELNTLPLLPKKIKKIYITKCNGMSNIFKVNLISPIFIHNVHLGIESLITSLEFKYTIKNFNDILNQISSLANVSSDIISTVMTVKMLENDFHAYLENIDFFQIKNFPKKESSNWNVEWTERMNSNPLIKKINLIIIDKSKFSNTQAFTNVDEIKRTPNEISSTFDPHELLKMLDELLKMLDKINFNEKCKSNFIDPLKIEDDGIKIINGAFIKNGLIIIDHEIIELRKKLKTSLENLLDRILNNTPFQAVPKAEIERKRWYGNLFTRLNKFINIARDSKDPATVSKAIIEIAISGFHCGSRWLIAVEEAIKSFDDYLHVDTINMDRIMGSWIDQYKQGVLSQITLDYNKMYTDGCQPHILNFAAKIMNKYFTTPEHMGIDLEDDFAIRELHVEGIGEKISYYLNSVRIATFIQGKIHALLEEDPSLVPFILNVFDEYAKTQLRHQIMEIENSSLSRKLEKGKLVASNSLIEFSVRNAILSEDQQAIEIFKKDNLLLFTRINQEEKTICNSLKNAVETDEDLNEEEELDLKPGTAIKIVAPFEKGIKRKAESEIYSQYRSIKRQKIEKKIKKYSDYIQDPENFEENLNQLGHKNIYQEINIKVNELTSNYLSEENIVFVDLYDGKVQVTVFGAIIFLLQLGYFQEINSENSLHSMISAQRKK